jgi:hypothetical protein
MWLWLWLWIGWPNVPFLCEVHRCPNKYLMGRQIGLISQRCHFVSLHERFILHTHIVSGTWWQSCVDDMHARCVRRSGRSFSSGALAFFLCSIFPCLVSCPGESNENLLQCYKNINQHYFKLWSSWRTRYFRAKDKKQDEANFRTPKHISLIRFWRSL